MNDTAYAVALVVPFLDAEDTLAEALDSVVGQTVFARIRTILVDNDSTDGSPAIAAAYAARHANIEVLHRVGGGCGGARNTAIAAAREPYVAFLDADDVLPPTSIERRLELIESTGADIVMGAIETFPDVRPFTPPSLYAEDRVIDGIAAEPRLVQVPNVAGVLLPRSFFDDPTHLFAEDIPFEDVMVTSAALIEASRIAISSEVCSRYRKDPTRTTLMSTAHTRPANYAAIVSIAENVHARHAHDPAAAAVAGRVVVRAGRRFLARAGSVLDDAALDAFFDRAQELYRHYDVDDIAPHLDEALWGLGFYAVKTGDVDLLRSPAEHVIGLELVDGVPHLRLDRPTVPAYRGLLRVRPLHRYAIGDPQPRLDSAWSTGRGAVELRGTIGPTAGRLEVPPHGFGFVLRVGTTDVAAPVQVVRNGDRARWVAVLDPRAVPPGRHRLALGAAAWSPRKRVGIVPAREVLHPAPGVELGPNRAGTGTFVTIRPTSP